MQDYIQDPNEERIGPYVVIGCISSGGRLGSVFQAMDPEVSRYVAIRVFPPECVADPQIAQILEAALTELQQLDHENIVRYFEAARSADDSLYQMMEYVEGSSLQKMIDSHAKPPMPHLIEFLVQTCRGLDYALQQNRIHGNLTPDRVLITGGGQIKIANIGLAPIFRDIYKQSGAFNNPKPSPYLAPECHTGGMPDVRSDIFSLGAIFYHLFSGKAPFSVDSSVMSGNFFSSTTPATLHHFLPDLPLDISNAIHRMLSRETMERFGSYEEVLTALNQDACTSESAPSTTATGRRTPQTESDHAESGQRSLFDAAESSEPEPAVHNESYYDESAAEFAFSETPESSVDNSGQPRHIPEIDPNKFKSSKTTQYSLIAIALLMILGGLFLMFRPTGSIEASETDRPIREAIGKFIHYVVGGKRTAEMSELEKRELTRTNMKIVYAAVEEYYVRFGDYPHDIDLLLSRDFLEIDDLYDGYGHSMKFSAAQQILRAPGSDGKHGTSDDFVFQNGRFLSEPPKYEKEMLDEEF